MATVAAYGNTWNTTAGNKTVGPTGVQGDLVVVICANSGRTTAQAPTVTDNLSGTTAYTLVASATKNTSADSMWVFIRDAFMQSNATFTITMTQSGDTGGGLSVFRVSGMFRAGLNALRSGQTGKQDNQAAGTPSITLPAALLTDNPSIGGVMTGSNSSTNTAQPTGWSENQDAGYNTPATGLETIYRSSGSTLTTIPWTAATATGFCSVLIELDASDPGGPPEPDAIEYHRIRQLLAH